MAVRYDTQKLKTDISIQSACAIAGIPVSRNGFIKCPDHLKNMGKPDKKATNCKIYPHSYVCYACGAKGDIFSLVKGYKESYEGELLSFSDTAKMLAEGSGNEKEYILSMSDIEEKSMDFFPIPDEVLSFCGIMTRVIPLSCPECMAYNKSDIPSNMEAVACPSSDSDSPVDDFYVGYSYRGAYGIKNLYRDDKDSFWYIVYPKLLLGLDKLKDLKDCFGGQDYRKLLNGIREGISIYRKTYNIPDEPLERKSKKELLNSLF